MKAELPEPNEGTMRELLEQADRAVAFYLAEQEARWPAIAEYLEQHAQAVERYFRGLAEAATGNDAAE